MFSLATLLAAQAPHARKTTPRAIPLPSGESEERLAPPYRSTASITLSVNSSQPFLECEPAVRARTVRQVFSNKTPLLAHAVRVLHKVGLRRKDTRDSEAYPCFGGSKSGYSALSSA